MNDRRFLITVSRILLVQLIVWIVLMAITMPPSETFRDISDYVDFVAASNILFILSYLNAGLLTIVVVFLFVALYRNFGDACPQFAMSALLLVPVYAVLNCMVYFSQITIIPILLRDLHAGTYSVIQVAPWLQCNIHSPVAIINALAYAILGVPSSIFGGLIIWKNEGYRLAGYFLILNAVLCILGLVGYVIQNSVLDKGIMLGGFLFTLAVVVFCFRPVRKKG